MISHRSFENFPLVEGENVKISIEPVVEGQETDDMMGAQNLKKQFKIPGMFYVPDPNPPKLYDKSVFNAIDMRGYKFFLPNNYMRNPDKESEFEDKQHGKNKITFQVKEQTPIDFQDKM